MSKESDEEFGCWYNSHPGPCYPDDETSRKAYDEAKAAWDEQQRRIDELEGKNLILRAHVSELTDWRDLAARMDAFIQEFQDSSTCKCRICKKVRKLHSDHKKLKEEE